MKKFTLIIAIALSIITCISAEGRKTIVKHRIEKGKNINISQDPESNDGIRRVEATEPAIIGSDSDGPIWFYPDSISFTGYDKTVQSKKESFLIVNRSNAEIKKIGIRITYLDMKDRMLHSQDATVTCTVPSGETRKGDIPSWDIQNTYFYYLGPEPRRVATPYKVRFQPLWFMISTDR